MWEKESSKTISERIDEGLLISEEFINLTRKRSNILQSIQRKEFEIAKFKSDSLMKDGSAGDAKLRLTILELDLKGLTEKHNLLIEQLGLYQRTLSLSESPDSLRLREAFERLETKLEEVELSISMKREEISKVGFEVSGGL